MGWGQINPERLYNSEFLNDVLKGVKIQKQDQITQRRQTAWNFQLIQGIKMHLIYERQVQISQGRLYLLTFDPQGR